MKKTNLLISLSFLICVIWFGCSKFETPNSYNVNLDLPEIPYNYEDITFPESFEFSRVDNTPENNHITNDGATLGRVLFYDGNLSLNNATSCASCHSQQKAFSDVVAKSTGFKGGLTRRNSMPIFNTRYMDNFFWDSRVESMEDQVIMPIADHIEMGLDDEAMIIEKLSRDKNYAELFKNAFGDETINMNRIKKALAQFVRSIASYQSKFDQGVENDFENFTTLELKGLDLFTEAQCNSCHVVEGLETFFMQNGGGFTFENNTADLIAIDNVISFFGGSQANIGLDEEYDDKGIYEQSNLPEDKGRFKIPSLRNIALTGPYMHDGRFATLDAVLEHYNNSIIDHQNLDFRLRSGMGNSYRDAAPTDSGQPVIFDFDKDDKEALIAFFNTLTDQSLINDIRYSNPFKK